MNPAKKKPSKSERLSQRIAQLSQRNKTLFTLLGAIIAQQKSRELVFSFEEINQVDLNTLKLNVNEDPTSRITRVSVDQSEGESS